MQMGNPVFVEPKIVPDWFRKDFPNLTSAIMDLFKTSNDYIFLTHLSQMIDSLPPERTIRSLETVELIALRCDLYY